MKRAFLSAVLLASCAGDPEPVATHPTMATAIEQLRERPVKCAGTRERMAQDLMVTRVHRDAANYFYASEAYVQCTLTVFERPAEVCLRHVAEMKLAKERKDGPAYFRESELYLACTRAGEG